MIPNFLFLQTCVRKAVISAVAEEEVEVEEELVVVVEEEEEEEVIIMNSVRAKDSRPHVSLVD